MLERVIVSREESNAIKGLLILLIALGHNSILSFAWDGCEPVEAYFHRNWLYQFHVYVFFMLPFIYNEQPYRKGKKGNIEEAESGDTTHVTHQTLTISFSFYGPTASELSDLFRDAAQLDQNFRYLASKGLTIQNVSDEVMRLPDLVGNQWRDRYTLEMKIGRVVSRRFGVRTLCSADFEIYTEKGKL